jgi:hypothetical protein
MDDILVVNAGSSSVKFEVFAVDGPAKLTRKIKGQIDGIGTRPRLRASGANGTSLIDREYDVGTIPDVQRCSQPMLGCGIMPSATASYMAAPSTTARSCKRGGAHSA